MISSTIGYIAWGILFLGIFSCLEDLLHGAYRAWVNRTPKKRESVTVGNLTFIPGDNLGPSPFDSPFKQMFGPPSGRVLQPINVQEHQRMSLLRQDMEQAMQQAQRNDLRRYGELISELQAQRLKQAELNVGPIKLSVEEAKELRRQEIEEEKDILQKGLNK